MSYATVAKVKAAMNLGPSDSLDDVSLTSALAAADQMITDYCGRSFDAAGTAVRVFTTTDDDCAYIDDAVSISLVEHYDGSAWIEWAATDWEALPLNGLRNGSPWPYTELRAIYSYDFPVLGRSDLRVTGTWGWASVPAVVEQAAIQQALRLFKRLDSALGYAGGPETGLIRVGRSIDADVAQLLAPYRKGGHALGGMA